MDWKNHPVMSALTAGAVTMAFCVTTVLPIWTKVLENKVDEYRKENELLKKTAEQHADILRKTAEQHAEILRNARERHTARIINLEKRNRQLAWDEIIIPDTPYPKGFRTVTIGDPISKVLEEFGTNEITTTKFWRTVNMNSDSEAIRTVTYYFDESAKISHILYFFASPESKSAVEDVNGGLGPIAYSAFEALKASFPDNKSNCQMDEDKYQCTVIAKNYIFKVTSSTYHLETYKQRR